MNALFDNQLAPLTYCVGFLEMPYEALREKALAWMRTNVPALEECALDQPFSQSLQQLQPVRTPLNKILLLETRGPWVAYFDNSRNGSDPAGFIGHLSQQLHCRGLRVRWEPASAAGDGPGTFSTSKNLIFTLYAPEEREWLNIERSISLVNDYGSWSFKASGTVQPYEQTERYTARRLRDRFTPEMLAAYCAQVGVHPFDAEFYGTRAHLVTLRPDS